MGLFGGICLIVAIGIAIWARNRMAALEAKLDQMDRRMGSLTERIFHAETALHQMRQAAPSAPPPIPHVAPAPVQPATVAPPVLRPQPMMPPVVAAPTPVAPGVDLESSLATNWLSKLGVLILLIGLALFLGLSLAALGPFGRIMMGAMASLSLLGAGIAAERKAQYKIIGAALIGGGWAGLYFTAFAAHGIAAARIIDSPTVGFVVLLLVAAGMIVHSLRYGSQTVTGLAYAAAFLTISISSLTRFSTIASIPLLLSLLAVSWRFGWQSLATAGALFAYVAYGFDLATGDKDRYFIAIGEPVLWTYWLILEVYDLAVLRLGKQGVLPLSPFNLTGFLLATAAVWPVGWQAEWMLLTMALAQLGSAVLRGRRSESGEMEDRSLLGGYRASITFSALFSAAFMHQRFSGVQHALGLLLLAQTIALSGWLLRSAYLRGLGACLFVFPVLATVGNWVNGGPNRWWPGVSLALATAGLLNRMFLEGGVWYSAGATAALAAVLADFSPVEFRPALLTIAAGMTGLALRWQEKFEAKGAGAALALLSLWLLLVGMPDSQVAITIGLPALLYAIYGYVLLEGPTRFLNWAVLQFFVGALLYRIVGQSAWLPTLWGLQALAGWMGGLQWLGRGLAYSALLPQMAIASHWFQFSRGQDWPGQALAVAALFGIYLRPMPAEDRDPSAEAVNLLQGLLPVFLLTALVGDKARGAGLTLAWGVEAVALLGLGLALRLRLLRLCGLAVFALCLIRLFFYDFSQLDVLSRTFSFIVLGCLLIGASWAYSRFRAQIEKLL